MLSAGSMFVTLSYAVCRAFCLISFIMLEYHRFSKFSEKCIEKNVLLVSIDPTFQQISRTFNFFEIFDDLHLEGHDLEGHEK